MATFFHFIYHALKDVAKKIKLQTSKPQTSYTFAINNIFAYFRPITKYQNSEMYIKDLNGCEGKEVTLQGWAANKRDSKGLVFLYLRDGTGMCQCVVSLDVVGEEKFNAAKKLTLESSFSITGKVIKDEKQIGGFEIQATDINVISYAEEFPIAFFQP